MEGKGQKDGKRPFPLRNTTDSSLTACVVRPHPRFLTVPSVSPCFPGMGLVVRCPTSWQAGRQEEEEGQALNARMIHLERPLETSCVF